MPRRPHPMPLRSLAAPLAALVLLGGCSHYEEVRLLDITNVEVKKLDLRAVALRVDVLVDNPNGFRIHVEDPDVELFLNDVFVGKGMLDSAVVLEPKRTQVYPIHLHADVHGEPLLMMMLVGGLNGTMKLGAKGTVAGRSGVLKKRFPFDVEERVPLND